MTQIKTLKRLNKIILVLTYVLVVIALVMVTRRILTMSGLITSFNPAGGRPFDTGFTGNPVVTFVHILPGAVFMILGPLQFMPVIRTKHIQFHRRSGRIFIFSAYIVGISALVMPFIMSPIGGLNEAVGSILFAMLFLIFLSRAWWCIVQKETARHREWMIRAFAIGLAIATVRPIMVLFFAFSGLQPRVFFGTAFWLGFTIHLVAAEIWINYTRQVLHDLKYIVTDTERHKNELTAAE